MMHPFPPACAFLLLPSVITGLLSPATEILPVSRIADQRLATARPAPSSPTFRDALHSVRRRRPRRASVPTPLRAADGNYPFAPPPPPASSSPGGGPPRAPPILPNLLRFLSVALLPSALRNAASAPPVRRPLSVAIRLVTSLITCVDFAPTASSQLRASSRAVASRPSDPTALRYRSAVVLKAWGDVLALAAMAALPIGFESACAAALMSSHLLFWASGGGAARVDAEGGADPVPPGLTRTIATADAVVGLAAASGAVGGRGPLGVVGRAGYCALVGAVCFEKLFGGRRADGTARDEADDGSAVKGEGTEDGAVGTQSGMPLGGFSPAAGHGGRVAGKEAGVESSSSSRGLGWETEFDWKRHWYPMAFAKVTDESKPHRLELFGESLVLWHDGNSWCALPDECPHRLAPLSEGRVDEEGQIECPYHGWTFTSLGSCTKIPQAEGGGNEATRAGCAAAGFYRVAERQGIVWVWGRPGATAEEADEDSIPVCPALEDDRFVWIDFSRDLPYSADMLLENVLDSSHVSFTHHKTISKRSSAKPLPLKVVTPIGPDGFDGRTMEEPRDGDDRDPADEGGDVNAARSRKSATETKRVERTTAFVAPTYMHHRIRTADDDDGDFDGGFETWTVAYATPTGPGRSRLLARFPFRFPPRTKGPLSFLPNVPSLVFRNVPDWLNHIGQLRVTDDDNVFLPIQERRTQELGGWTKYRMPTDADAYVRAYRLWMDAAGRPPHSHFAVDAFRSGGRGGGPPPLADLLDRKAQHADHCKSCAGALRNARRVKALSRAASLLVVATAAPTLGLRRAWGPLATATAAAGIAFQAGRVARFVETSLTTGLENYPPPRNRPDMKGGSRELRTVDEGRRT